MISSPISQSASSGLSWLAHCVMAVPKTSLKCSFRAPDSFW